MGRPGLVATPVRARSIGVNHVRMPWQKRQVETVDPRRPHAFRVKSDDGIGALAPIGGGVGRQVADIAAAGAYTRTAGCGVPGCGRSRDDAIHAPADE